MCFGGGSKPQSSTPPAAAPTPQTMSPTDVDSAKTAEERRQKLNRMRSGLASTIKTSFKGVTGSGADLLQQTISGKNTLGA